MWTGLGGPASDPATVSAPKLQPLSVTPAVAADPGARSDSTTAGPLTPQDAEPNDPVTALVFVDDDDADHPSRARVAKTRSRIPPTREVSAVAAFAPAAV